MGYQIEYPTICLKGLNLKLSLGHGKYDASIYDQFKHKAEQAVLSTVTFLWQQPLEGIKKTKKYNP